MAIFPVVHTETGEKKEIDISVHKIMEWYNDNPEWTRDWSAGCASAANEGEWKSKLANRNPGWKTVLDRVKKAPGSRAKDLY